MGAQGQSLAIGAGRVLILAEMGEGETEVCLVDEIGWMEFGEFGPRRLRFLKLSFLSQLHGLLSGYGLRGGEHGTAERRQCESKPGQPEWHGFHLSGFEDGGEKTSHKP
jgi:hypothetical protein